MILYWYDFNIFIFRIYQLTSSIIYQQLLRKEFYLPFAPSRAYCLRNFIFKPFIFFVFLLIANFALSQKQTSEHEITGFPCIKKNNQSFSARLTNYPFNKTSHIKIVSFKSNIDTSGSLYMVDFDNDSLPMTNKGVAYPKLNEIKNLSLLQIENLTDILYNYGFPHPLSKKGNPTCNNPKNAILFFYTTGKVFEFIEISFECRRLKLSSDKILVGDLCNQKLYMLKGFFANAGIEFGVIKEHIKSR